MSIDLNQLPIEAGTVPQVDFDNYVDPTEFAPPIPEGTYNFKTTSVEIEKFDPATGIVSFLMNHDAFDTNTGEKVGSINFDRISTKVFNRQNIPASMAADQLRAIGSTERPTSPREWGEQIVAVKAFSDQGGVWAGAVQWDGYCGHKDTQYETQVDQNKKPLVTQTPPHALAFAPRGEKAFKAAVNGSGDHSVIKCPVCASDVQARAKISRRIPK